MDKKVYRKLAQHLDRLPGGFSPCENGADLRLLERLFTSQDAELAVHLTLDPDTAVDIAARAGLPPAVASARLHAMVDKGLIWSTSASDGTQRFQALPMVIGIYEYQINNMSQDLLDAFQQYWSAPKSPKAVQSIPQTRIIPIGASIGLKLECMPYEQVNKIIDTHTSYAVTACICRHTAKMRGEGCNSPEESCLVFGEWADYYIRTGRGRAIDRRELLAILARADAANLVLQPSNSKSIEFICTCCGCCCGILGSLKAHPRPADIVSSAFIARLVPEKCESCWTCLERCQMDAIVAGAVHAILQTERCIGCGLCVSTCPNEALLLERRSEVSGREVPATLTDTWKIIAEDRAKA